MQNFFFDSWWPLLRIAVVGVLAYVSLIVCLRVSGKRTLSKMNAFDFLVTVALGSTLATTMLSHDIALAEGVLAFAMLVGLQYAITWSSVRWGWVRHVVTGEPTLLVHRGVFLGAALRKMRVNESELRAAVRSAGVLDLEEAEAVVLETDGSFSVIRRNGDASHHPATSSLAGVQGAPPQSSAAALPPGAP